jgi:hypothetical protein
MSAFSVCFLDGRPDEWQALSNKRQWQYPAMDLTISHDEAYLYLLARKRNGPWEPGRDQLYFGFSTLSGGSRTSDQSGGLVFNRPMQFLLRLRGDDDARWFVSSAYDQHTFRWGVLQSIIPSLPEYADPSLGKFLPWKLLTNRALTLPGTGERIPAEEVEIGILRRGTADARDPESRRLAGRWRHPRDSDSVDAARLHGSE